MNEALLERIQLLHQESEALEERISFIDKQVHELTDFFTYLAILETSQEKQFFSSIGKGVFMEAQRGDIPLLVDVGAGVLVKKKIPDVRTIIQGQLQGLSSMRSEAQKALHGFHVEFETLIEQIEKSRVP